MEHQSTKGKCGPRWRSRLIIRHEAQKRSKKTEKYAKANFTIDDTKDGMLVNSPSI